MELNPHTRTRTRTRTRRRSTCHRHPNEPVIGLCALCLRDRLAGLDTSSDQLQGKHETIVSFPLSRRTRGHGGGSSSGAVPELRRSKSVAVEKCEVLNDLSLDLRRKSCDVRASSRLTDLFDVDDTKSGGDGGVIVESKHLGFLSVVEPVMEVIEDRDDCSEIRVSNDLNVRNEVGDDGEIGEEGEDLRTMKEHIEMELQNKKKNFWEAASVFSQKLRKWRQKHKEKKQSDNNRSNFSRFKDSQIQYDVADYGLGRRSCDTAPRFSVDAHRMSVDDPQCSYDEHRASWDGYMVARTIPRLTPMLPIVDDMIFPPVNKRITLKEDGSSCGASAKSNSDSSSSNAGSSSSSMKSSSSKAAGLEGKYMKPASQRNDVIGQETKLVITERELNNWHLSSVNDSNVESASNAPISAHKTVKNGWRKVSNLWSYKSKHRDKKNDSYIHDNRPSLDQNNEINGVARGNSRGRLFRNSSYVGSRNTTELLPNGQEGARHSVSDIESGLMRLHFSSIGKSRKNLAQSIATDD